MTELLSNIEIDEALTGLREWRRDDDGLIRTVDSPSFPDAIDLVRRVADEAELADHHPDIDIRYTSVTYRLSTHSVPGHPGGGITGKDVLLAAAIDRLAG